MGTRTRAWGASLLMVLPLVVASCGDDASTADDTTTTEAAGDVSTTTGAASADPLAPQPLDETTGLKVSVSVVAEPNADLFLADALGEFERENLDVQIAPAPIPDATALLISGDVDIIQGGMLPPQMNAISQGADLRMIVSGPTFPPGDDFGVWARADLWEGDEVDPCAFEGANVSVGGVAGWGSAMAGPFVELLRECDLEPSDINLVNIAPPDGLIALENGSVDAAYLTDPFWGQAVDGGYAKLAVRYGDATSVGWMVGENPDDEVIDAFVRAILRTRQTYLQGDYKQDPEVRAALIEALGVPEASLDATPPLVWDDGEWDDALLAPVQDAWVAVGGIMAFTEPLTKDDLWDPSFLERVLGG